MKKQGLTVLLTASMVLAMGSTAFGAEWKQDGNGWWWQEDQGSYPVSTWQWIDGNGGWCGRMLLFQRKRVLSAEYGCS